MTDEPSFSSYVAAATPTVPRQEWHATPMRGLSGDFPLNKENMVCRNILQAKNKNKMSLCFTVAPYRKKQFFLT